MHFFDTHCHIHDPEFADKYQKSVDVILSDAAAEGVDFCTVVGTSLQSSTLAIEFAENHKKVFSSIAIHPHEVAELSQDELEQEVAGLKMLAKKGSRHLVAIGECGLDYYYHADKAIREGQKKLFRHHVDLAIAHNLPLIFHIRDAFDDFFAILDEYTAKGTPVRGVVHSFSAHKAQLDGAVARGLYIGLNGIMTFSKDSRQLEAAKAVPLENLVLETDAPFLTPKPFRGTMCELKHVVVTAQFLSDLRGESLQEIASRTTANAKTLFCL